MIYRVISGDFARIVQADEPLAAAREALAAVIPGTPLGVLTQVEPMPEGTGEAEYVATAFLLGGAE